jgi:hypothetical protein
VGPCHHGMVRPPAADGGDGLNIWRLAANVLNRQSRTTDKGSFSSLGRVGVGEGLATPHRKKASVAKCYTGPRNWTDSLERPRHRWEDNI